MEKFAEKEAIRIYLRLMRELTIRIELVAYACDGNFNLTPPYAREYSYLQYRRICELIALGSRSRRDALSDSDWDFLILVDGSASDERTDRIRHKLYEIEWESGEVISSIVRNREEWDSDLYQTMPFHQRVQEEGIKL